MTPANRKLVPFIQNPRSCCLPCRASPGSRSGYAPRFSSAGGQTHQPKVYSDPELSANLLCNGGIVLMKAKEACPGGVVDSWPTNRMGLKRDSTPFRDPPWGHPVHIMSWRVDLSGRTLVTIATITSFNTTPFDQYVEHRRLYATGQTRHRKCIKYANTIPIYHPEGTAAKYLGHINFLHTTGAPMLKQSYVALGGIYVVPVQFLRAFGVRYPNCWDIRLQLHSYRLLMSLLGEDEGPYESLESMQAKWKAHQNAEGTVVPYGLMKISTVSEEHARASDAPSLVWKSIHPTVNQKTPTYPRTSALLNGTKNDPC